MLGKSLSCLHINRRRVSTTVGWSCTAAVVMFDVLSVGLSDVRHLYRSTLVCSTHSRSASVASWIIDDRLSLAAVVETWHDGHDSPGLIACTPSGYSYIEKARPRMSRDLTTNHGGVCLFYRSLLNARNIHLSDYSSMEYVCAMIHGSGVKVLVIAVYDLHHQRLVSSSTTSLMCWSVPLTIRR